jgi:hypothetical protein
VLLQDSGCRISVCEDGIHANRSRTMNIWEKLIKARLGILALSEKLQNISGL